ncbi:hypothetical protein HPG69_014764 [Diceros bicornis minor]|uniref:Uncharacterized protein n=1 Tax=Diceros bicornis minor TaxID=77932 RepID=A0A7J7EII3_DICBM|nr:hypothetical protein HPG69_014764 [Diceros bicornis minor]
MKGNAGNMQSAVFVVFVTGYLLPCLVQLHYTEKQHFYFMATKLRIHLKRKWSLCLKRKWTHHQEQQMHLQEN